MHRQLFKKKVTLSAEWASCLNDTCMIPPTNLNKTDVAISVLTHGKSWALVEDLLKNLIHYTYPDTLIVVHHNPFDSHLNVTVRQLFANYISGTEIRPDLSLTLAHLIDKADSHIF